MLERINGVQSEVNLDYIPIENVHKEFSKKKKEINVVFFFLL